MDVYGVVLDSIISKGTGSVYFSDQTTPLHLSDSDIEDMSLQGIKLPNAVGATQTIHAFDASIANGHN